MSLTSEVVDRKDRARSFSIVTAILLVGAIASAIVGHFSYPHILLVLIAGGAASVVVVVSAMVAALRPGADRWSVQAFRFASLVLAALVLSIALGYPMRALLVHRSQEWCERQVPAIDRYRAERGEYPPSLADLHGVESPLWFCAPVYEQVRAHGDEFYFYVRDAPPVENRWSSKRRAWEGYGQRETSR